MINKIFSIVLIFTLILPKVCKAEEQEFDYEHLIAGSCVSKDGFFFTEEGMVSLVVNTKEKIRLATLDGQRQIDLLKVDLRACSQSKEAELRVQKQMFEKQLAIKQQTIDSYQGEAFWGNIKGVGGLLIGFGAAFLLFKLTNL